MISRRCSRPPNSPYRLCQERRTARREYGLRRAVSSSGVPMLTLVSVKVQQGPQGSDVIGECSAPEGSERRRHAAAGSVAFPLDLHIAGVLEERQLFAQSGVAEMESVAQVSEFGPFGRCEQGHQRQTRGSVDQLVESVRLRGRGVHAGRAGRMECRWASGANVNQAIAAANPPSDPGQGRPARTAPAPARAPTASTTTPVTACREVRTSVRCGRAGAPRVRVAAAANRHRRAASCTIGRSGTVRSVLIPTAVNASAVVIR
uniref:Uncharacterized protein n=1 Tax=Rhodococcus sp. NS1 TaxID=402236 RepID=A0A097SQ76_9NOCA|nr:hypothetical protein LRS1606.245 [Rhodococcus sp. NS1]